MLKDTACEQASKVAEASWKLRHLLDSLLCLCTSAGARAAPSLLIEEALEEAYHDCMCTDYLISCVFLFSLSVVFLHVNLFVCWLVSLRVCLSMCSGVMPGEARHACRMENMARNAAWINSWRTVGSYAAVHL